MRITDLLKRESISLKAAPANKAECLEMAISLMEKAGNISDHRAYKEQVFFRETEGTTGIGDGIAIPHGKCDAVIMSLGTSPNPLISSTTKGLEANRRGCIVADEEKGQTSKEGVFAGGDAVTGAATVILAMGAGKAAARGIDEYLSAK